MIYVILFLVFLNAIATFILLGKSFKKNKTKLATGSVFCIACNYRYSNSLYTCPKCGYRD